MCLVSGLCKTLPVPVLSVYFLIPCSVRCEGGNVFTEVCQSVTYLTMHCQTGIPSFGEGSPPPPTPPPQCEQTTREKHACPRTLLVIISQHRWTQSIPWNCIQKLLLSEELWEALFLAEETNLLVLLFWRIQSLWKWKRKILLPVLHSVCKNFPQYT